MTERSPPQNGSWFRKTYVLGLLLSSYSWNKSFLHVDICSPEGVYQSKSILEGVFRWQKKNWRTPAVRLQTSFLGGTSSRASSRLEPCRRRAICFASPRCGPRHRPLER